ncbi:hypothetical protein GCM10023324_04690 [Streptomyces youssoufiensis]
MTDNGSCYRSRQWRDALAATDVTHERTRPYRPRTNGTVERFHRTLIEERAYARPPTAQKPNDATPSPMGSPPTVTTAHTAHTALKGQPPASRVPHLTGRYG